MSEQIDNIGPAFPNQGDGQPWDGMSKLELFAAMAMQGIVANPKLEYSFERTSRAAVIHADDLLAELDKRKNITRDRISNTCAEQAAQIVELIKEREALRQAAKGNYWAWQGDGGDHLESLVCPVLIRADKLKAIIDGKERYPAGSLSFEIYSPGEIGAGLRPFSDEVSVSCKSGQWGGDPGEFEAYMRDCLKEWYDGATVIPKS